MREAISNALSSSLDWDDSEHERAVDKLTAFSYSKRLGTLLWRLKYHNDHTSLKPAVFLLAKELPRLNRGIAIKICEQAVHEWLMAFCPVCFGAKEVRSGEHIVICGACGGSGVRKYTNAERARAIGANMEKQFKQIHDLIGGIDRHVSEMTKLKLDRR
jgi:hypothetical protein